MHNSGYTVVGVHGQRLELRGKTIDGDVIDTLEIDKSDEAAYKKYVQAALAFESIDDREETAGLLGRAKGSLWEEAAKAEQTGGDGNTSEAYVRALDMLEKAYELDATCAECVVAMGIVNNLLGRQSQAMELLHKGMAMKPQYPDSYEALVGIYLDGNRLEKATEVALKWREIEPDQTAAEEALAQIYSKQGKPGKAIAALRRALVIVPSDAAVHEGLAGLYAELGLHAEAIQHYQEAMKWIDAENTERLQELARSIEALSR